MILEANGPLDLAHTLESGQAFRWRRDGAWHRGIVGPNVYLVREAPGGVEFESAPEPPEQTAEALRSYLRLDDDLAALYRRLRKDSRLREAIDAYGGLRLLRQEPWECLVAFVISVYSNIPRITGNIEDLCRRFGDRIDAFGAEAHAFPGPALLAEVGEAEFREMGLGFRARFLARLAGSVLERRLDLLALRRRSYADARSALLELYGVGDKVADCVLAFSLDQGDAFPVDVWVRRAVQESYFEGGKLTDRAVRLWAAEHFGRDAAYAQQYLFHRRRLLGKAERKKAPAPQQKSPRLPLGDR